MFNGSNGYSLADIAAATAGGNGNGNGGFGWGNDGGWWIIIFLLALGGGWGSGGWGGGSGNNGTTAVVGREVSYGFDMNNLENGIRGIQNGLCDGFYAMNNGLMTTTAQLQSTLAQGFGGVNTALLGLQGDMTLSNLQNTNAITAQLTNMAANDAQCCCETKNLINSNFADLSYRLATQDCATRQTINDAARDIIASQNDGFRAILDRMTTDRITALETENASLRSAQSQSNQNAFLISQLAPKAIPAYIAPNPYTGAYGYGGAAYGCGSNYGVSCGC